MVKKVLAPKWMVVQADKCIYTLLNDKSDSI